MPYSPTPPTHTHSIALALVPKNNILSLICSWETEQPLLSKSARRSSQGQCVGKEKPRLRSLAEYSTFCATRSAPKDKRTVSLHRSRQQSPEQIKDKHFYSAEHNESLGPEMRLAAKSLFVFLSSVLLLFFLFFYQIADGQRDVFRHIHRYPKPLFASEACGSFRQ